MADLWDAAAEQYRGGANAHAVATPTASPDEDWKLWSDEHPASAPARNGGEAPPPGYSGYGEQQMHDIPVEMGKGLVGGIQTLLHPIDAFHSIVGQVSDAFGKAKAAKDKGDYIGALAALSRGVPGLGQAQQMLEQGKWGATIGMLGGAATGGEALGLAGDVATNPGTIPALQNAAVKTGDAVSAASNLIPRMDRVKAAYADAQQTRAMQAQAVAGTPQRTVQGLAADRTLTHQPLPEMPGAPAVEGPSMPSVPTAPENPHGVQLGDFARRLMNGQSLSGVPTPPLSNPGLPPLPAEFEAALRAKAPDPTVRATPEQPTPVGPQAQPGQHPVYGQPLTPLDSDAVQSIAYHEPTQTARVQIKGRDYTLPMTPEMHNRLLAASADPQQSVGKLWNQEIRPTLETKSGVLGPKAATSTPETAAPTMEQRLAASPDAVALRNEVLRRTASQHLSPTDLEAVARKTAADINTGRAAGGNARGTIPDWVVADVLKGLRQ